MRGDRLQSVLFIIFEALKVLLLIPALAWLFFDEPVGTVIILPYGIYLLLKIKGKHRRFMREKYLFQFKDALGCLLTALEAGYSIEKAVVSAKQDIGTMYGSDACMFSELQLMERKLSLGQNVESVIEEFAIKTEVPEIIGFSDIFSAAKRSGGNLIGLMRSAVKDIYEKTETRREIESIISANRTECLIMQLMPPAILLYFKAFSPGFLDPLYATALGRLAMVVLAAVYFFMCEYGKRITEKVSDG